MASFSGFPKDTTKFLRDLKKNNNRDWFNENKPRYESSVLAPALELIAALEKPLDKVAPLLTVKAKRVGGSLMRIYKDTRFSKDKTPYKTNVGIQFRHQAGKDVHAPGIYFHIEPGECFLGAGIWRPASDALRMIRNYIVENETTWMKMRRNKRMFSAFEMHDDRLKSAPRGFAKDHPLIDELRLKSFIALSPISKDQLESESLVKLIPKLTRDAQPLMSALCEALGQPY